MLGPSFVSGGQQIFEFVRMMAHNEVYLRCAQLANASRVLGNLGDDILSKITLKSGVGTIVETGSDDGHFMALRGPEHPRLVAGFNRHHAFIPVRLRLWSAGHKRTASPACAGRAAALL